MENSKPTPENQNPEMHIPEDRERGSGIRRINRIKRWLIGLCFIFLCFIIILCIALIYLPRIVSSSWFKARLEQHAHHIFKRPVSLERLTWTWSEGILINGVQVRDDSSFSDKPLISIDTILLTIDFQRLVHRRLVFNLSLRGLDARLIRDRKGRTNLGQLLSVMKGAEKKDPEPSPPKDWRHVVLALPVDIQGRVLFSHLSIMIEDRSQDCSMKVHDASLLREVPSLMDKTIILTLPDLSGDIELAVNVAGDLEESVKFLSILNGKNITVSRGSLKKRTMGPFQVRIFHEGAMNVPRGILEVTTGEIQVQKNSRVSWHGIIKNLTSPEPEASVILSPVSFDLSELNALAKDFVPADVSGRVELDMRAGGIIKGPIQFDTSLIGKDLYVSGDMVKGKHIGPFYFKASHKGTFDARKGIFNIKEGYVQAQENSRISWHGTVNSLNAGKPEVGIILSPVSIDLKEIYKLAGEFIPAGMPLTFGDKGEEVLGEVRIKEVRLNGSIPEGPRKIVLDGLLLTLPHIGIGLPQGLLKAEDFIFRVSHCDVGLASFFPKRAELLADLKARNVDFKGQEEIRVERLAFPLCRVIIRDISRSPGSLFGLRGTFFLDELALIEGLDMPLPVRIPKLCQSLKAECVLNSGSAEVQVERIGISAPSLGIEALPYGPVETPLEFEANIQGLHLFKLNPLKMDMEEMQARLEAGELFQARVGAIAHDLGAKAFNAHGDMALNVGYLFSLLPPKLPLKADMEGNMELSWMFLGRIPDIDEIERIMKGDASLMERFDKNKFIDEFQIIAKLKDINVGLPLSQDSSIKVSGIHSAMPLRLTLKNGLKQCKMDGKFIFGRIEELPSIGKLDHPINVTLSYTGSLENLIALQFFETIHVAPLNIEQSLQLSIDKIDRLLTSPLTFQLPGFLEKLEGTFSGKVKAVLDRDLEGLKEALSLKGQLEAGGEIHLSGGEEIRARSWIESPGLDIHLGTRLGIKNLRSHINLEKRYHFISKSEGDSTKTAEFHSLSMDVLNPRTEAPPPAEVENSIVRRLTDD
ncbi:MAG: hypothetical protein SV375_11285, partial [Thermodesulfobacteriota bacterium]|nr:hypothetical protein [Thermodesulfobacteriota bacterium]